MSIAIPHFDKMKSVMSETQAAHDFVEFLHSRGMEICFREEGYDRLCPVGQSIDTLLAEWKGIDLKECENERRALLDRL